MACSCLSRLQDPNDKSDPVLKALLFAIGHDASNMVRRAALMNLGISSLTLTHILLRTKDITPDIRVAAYNGILFEALNSLCMINDLHPQFALIKSL